MIPDGVVLDPVGNREVAGQLTGRKGRLEVGAHSERSDEILMEYVHRWENNLKRADFLATILELPGAHHYMFLSEESEVLREIKSFLQTLPALN